MKCRFCDTPLKHSFADLGLSPLANSYLTESQLGQSELFYPLHAFVCSKCFLVQIAEFESPDNIFSDYAYFSSYSDTWLAHAKQYAEEMIDRFGLNSKSRVVEIASNDGYLLQYFVEKQIPVLGVEPARNVAKVAQEKGIPTVVKFFGYETATELAADGKYADLVNGINVLAQVPDLHDFAKGFKIILKSRGVVTLEFPHLMRLVEENQWDTIYHEHFSYFSLYSVREIFAKHDLRVFDVEELDTFGGSIRVFLCHAKDDSKSVGDRVPDLLDRERKNGMNDINYYLQFNKKVKQTKRDILAFFAKVKAEGKTVVGYGAPAKGNTLLNYCGIGRDLIGYTVDRSPHKQDHFLPGTHIPIYHPDKITETQPDYLIIMPWNIKEEIMEQMSHIRDWGGRFVTFIPKVVVYQ
jgi:hypothetical protein